MFKTILIIVMAVFCLNFNTQAQSQSTFPLPNKQAILGKIISSTTGEVLPGAVIKIVATNQILISDQRGEFVLTIGNGFYNLLVSHMSYETKNINIQIPLKEQLVIKLETDNKNLKEVEIVSTGYQDIPKERATGSFTIIDQKTLNRSVGINILDRLTGVASGLITKPLFDGRNEITIHGRSTIFAEAAPLIVLNGFPYEGTIEQINPADVETINILKDAAASSIWGARSGNGVIVITTKSGSRNKKPTVGFTSSISITDKPDLNYISQLSPSEFIDLERYLFGKGMYNSQFNNPYNGVSPVVEILNQRKLDLISKVDSAAQIDALRNYDVRDDLTRYIYRPKVQQQYHASVSGGSTNHKYYMSGGYDKNLEEKRANSYYRVSLSAINTFTILKDRLDVFGDVNFVSSNTNVNGTTYNPRTPYDKLADEYGNSLAVVGKTTFRTSYIDTAGNGRLLDWAYRPKDELSATNSQTRLDQYRIRTGLKFEIIKGLQLTASYQYVIENSKNDNSYDVNSYYTRNLINQFSSISGNAVKRVIPLGDHLNENINMFSSKTFRTQVNYNKVIDLDHNISFIAGYEGSDIRRNTNTQVYYGYNPQTLVNANGTINPLNEYKYYYGSSGTIQTAPSSSARISIDQSFYTNASYAYKDRYILSGSVRRDESNLFGVKTNQKGVPLWSAGLAWNIYKESFYNIAALPVLKMRLTYGSNGNVDKSLSALLTSTHAKTNNLMGNLFASIQNPPNPSLRWEKIKTWNVGLDFFFKEDIISGSIDVYYKNAIDLIGNNPIAFQSGISQFKGNGANVKNNGLDLVVNSRNLKGKVGWRTSLLFNYNTNKVTSYLIKGTSNSNIVNNTNPLEGFPISPVFSFPSSGLDNTGAPQGVLNGLVSKDYTKLLNQLDIKQLKYHGSLTPSYFGSLNNIFAYRNFELSVNLIYKFDYYFRRTNTFTGSNYGTGGNTVFNLSDYHKRWQKPGDELTTRVPALIYPESSLKNSFYRNSEDLVEKGDHVRLQDIRLSYNLPTVASSKSALKHLSIFVYMKNLGVLWAANDLGIDPDYKTDIIPQPFSGSFGFTFTLN